MAILKKGRHWTDIPRTLMEDLGFSIGVWNGAADDASASLRISCGCYANIIGAIDNPVVLYPPDGIANFSAPDASARILKALVAAFDPEWGGVIHSASREARNCAVGRPVVDWIFYINRLDIDRTKLPASASIEPVGTLGTIIVVQDHPIDPTNPQDLENIKMVEAAVGLDK